MSITFVLGECWGYTVCARYLLDGTPMPIPFEEEMAMTRAMLALHEAAVTRERVTVRYPDRKVR
jgi:hypothetical protein